MFVQVTFEILINIAKVANKDSISDLCNAQRVIRKLVNNLQDPEKIRHHEMRLTHRV